MGGARPHGCRACRRRVACLGVVPRPVPPLCCCCGRPLRPGRRDLPRAARRAPPQEEEALQGSSPPRLCPPCPTSRRRGRVGGLPRPPPRRTPASGKPPAQACRRSERKVPCHPRLRRPTRRVVQGGSEARLGRSVRAGKDPVGCCRQKVKGPGRGAPHRVCRPVPAQPLDPDGEKAPCRPPAARPGRVGPLCGRRTSRRHRTPRIRLVRHPPLGPPLAVGKHRPRDKGIVQGTGHRYRCRVRDRSGRLQGLQGLCPQVSLHKVHLQSSHPDKGFRQAQSHLHRQLQRRI